jgi:cysteinyl-tRNA synthetase
MDLYLHNTMTRRKEAFRPLFDDYVGLYTCGPTVYNYAHIGNLRTFLFEDVLVRVLIYNGFRVRRVMNITDVGHLTGDRDMGEDKLEKGAKKEGKSAWELAAYYTEAFERDMDRLNLLPPDVWCKATETIPEQIDLIRTLEEKGYTYRTSDGIYFDTLKFPDYARLSNRNLDALLEGARVERNPEKRNPTDFALWKFSPEGARRQMEWESPWGIGFPGWHIECSAMSMKFLGDHLDIHCGGADHIDVHHTNEIAQSEAATGKPFFRFWMHGAFLQITGGKKMAKSADNFLTLENALIARDIDPPAYRYAAFLTHYRNPMEYSEASIQAARNGLNHLRNQVRTIREAAEGSPAESPHPDYRDKFREALNDDLNMPRAMAVVQETLKADISPAEKWATALDFDRVLGFALERTAPEETLPAEVRALAAERERARRDKDWGRSDELRDRLQAMGYTVRDGRDGMKVFKS